MVRLGRYFLPGQPLHVIQRGIDRQAVFFSPGEYARYRDSTPCAVLAFA